MPEMVKFGFILLSKWCEEYLGGPSSGFAWGIPGPDPVILDLNCPIDSLTYACWRLWKKR